MHMKGCDVISFCQQSIANLCWGVVGNNAPTTAFLTIDARKFSTFATEGLNSLGCVSNRTEARRVHHGIGSGTSLLISLYLALGSMTNLDSFDPAPRVSAHADMLYVSALKQTSTVHPPKSFFPLSGKSEVHHAGQPSAEQRHALHELCRGPMHL
eukprot:6461838-Amphidinium_carterae.2